MSRGIAAGRERTALRASIATPALVGFVALVLAACGGRQEPVAPVVEDTGPAPCCFDERWAEPPPEIGQTPPAREAPEGALEPFRPE